MQVRKSSQKQKKHVTQVSRFLLIIIGLLVVLGLSIWLYYGRETTSPNMSTDMTSCKTNDDCELENKDYTSTSSVCCPDLSSSNIGAFNANWYNQQYKQAYPNPPTHICTEMCMRPNYEAACIYHICQKVKLNFLGK